MGILLPIGGQMQVGTAGHSAREQGNQRGLHQSALLMAFFGPRIWKEDVYAIERPGHQHVLQYLGGVMLHDADIAKTVFTDQLQQSAHSRCVHFNGQVIVFRMSSCDQRGRFAHAESDFEDFRRLSAKHGIQVKRGLCVGNAEHR